VRRPFAPKEFELHINLNLGQASAVMYALRFDREYVDFNKGDVTDSASLEDNDFDKIYQARIIFRLLEFAARESSAT